MNAIDRYNDFSVRCDEFVRSLFLGHEPLKYNSTKVIHDCVWGSFMFYPWELEIMDSPLLQRLRRINQLGLAQHTYPSAHHTRFEHTLGVVAVADKMIKSINANGDLRRTEGVISDEHICMIRLAALLHDVGHCFFSHLSEAIYSETDEFSELYNDDRFKNAQAHEIFAYCIINTPTFKDFIMNSTSYPYKTDELFHNLGSMIIGRYIEPKNQSEPKPYYLTEIINGQFDADALDYLRRDSYATGLDLTYNLDRFLHKINVIEIADGDGGIIKRLTVPTSGISTVEEMMYNKLMLTRYIYHHQKVLAVESLIRDITQGLRNCGMLQHPCDFLYFCDDDIYRLASRAPSLTLSISKSGIGEDTTKTLSDIVNKIQTRKLPKKALIMNLHTIKTINGCEHDTMELSKALRALKGVLRREIYEKTKQLCNLSSEKTPEFDLYDIHVSIPKLNTAKDYSGVYTIGGDKELIPISDVVDFNDYARAFTKHSWSAYVFAEPAILPYVSIASKQVLEGHGVEFRENVYSVLKSAGEITELEKRLLK